jgi:uncharacterized protein DUF3768
MIEFSGGNGKEEHLNEDSEEYREKVRELNDTFRASFSGGIVNMTSGVQALGEKDVLDICMKVKTFDKFTQDNDPYGEHDFGVIHHDGQTINWKIDYYDLKLEYHSPDKSDPTVTARVLTIMLAEEY